FLEIHPPARELDRHGLRLGVLPEMPLPRLLVAPADRVGPPEGVQHRPVVDALDGVVRSVVAAPALDAEQVAAIVEIAAEVLAARLLAGPEQFPLQERPPRWRHRRLEAQLDFATAPGAKPRRRGKTRQNETEAGESRADVHGCSSALDPIG